MTGELKKTLCEMAAPVLPTKRQVKKLLDGWEDYFRCMGIKPARQHEEFDAIMRERVAARSIRLAAPNVSALAPLYRPDAPHTRTPRRRRGGGMIGERGGGEIGTWQIKITGAP